MKKLLLASIGLSLLVLWALGCGGGSGGGTGGGGMPTPTGPSNPPPPPASTTVNIVSSSGSAAFDPNPIPSQRMVGSINGSSVPRPPDNDDDGYLAPALSQQ